MKIDTQIVIFYIKKIPTRYGEAFKKMGLKVYTGDGGFYHWMELPNGLNADEFNKRLFKKGAAILKGSDCDMGRPHAKGNIFVI